MKIEGSSNSHTGVSRLTQALKSTFEAFEKGDFALAETEAEKALAIDFEHPEVVSALKCAVFWKDRVLRLRDLPSPESRGDFLFKEYLGFQKRFLGLLDSPLPEGLYAIRQFVFGSAAQSYIEQLEMQGRIEGELVVKAAKALKGCGDFDRAIGYLETALRHQRDDAQALAELGDCFEMINETRKAKLFFREAFYLGAQKIDLDQLQSVMIRGVVDSLQDRSFSPAVMKEWIPVYGTIQGVFNVKRELKPLELGQLKQSIFALKNELHENSAQQGVLLPKLLNRYFWLIDHYLSVKEDRSKIEEVLLNVKLLDQNVYELYTH